MSLPKGFIWQRGFVKNVKKKPRLCARAMENLILKFIIVFRCLKVVQIQWKIPSRFVQIVIVRYIMGWCREIILL
ncbi:hypothetical protein RD02_13760 [Pectobacterium brasiliense]|nr:hypothetical protein RD02_13760 [Pectobacterium brasiliense]